MSLPWFPFHVGDYLCDTGRLTTQAHGAYLLLILDYWANGAPPDDDETLASIARLSPDDWHKLRGRLAPFFQITDGRWMHERIEKERQEAAEKYRKRVNAGRARARADQSAGNATAMPPALLYQPQPQPDSEPEPDSESESDSRSIAAATRPRVRSRCDEFRQASPRRNGTNPRRPAEVTFGAQARARLPRCRAPPTLSAKRGKTVGRISGA